MPRLVAALRELPPQLCEPEGSWQHGLLQGTHASAATQAINPTTVRARANPNPTPTPNPNPKLNPNANQAINPTTDPKLAALDQGAREREEVVPAAEREAQRVMARSGASLCFLGTGAMKPSSYRNVRPLLHAPCTRHACAMHAPCMRHAHAMRTPCTRLR